MSERVQDPGQRHQNPSIPTKMANDIGPRKTMIVVVIVVGCFAVLWPKVFYPMLVGPAHQHAKTADKIAGRYSSSPSVFFGNLHNSFWLFRVLRRIVGNRR